MAVVAFGACTLTDVERKHRRLNPVFIALNIVWLLNIILGFYPENAVIMCCYGRVLLLVLRGWTAVERGEEKEDF